MSNASVAQPVARRSFLSRLGLGAAALTGVAGSVLPATAQTPATPFQPARHPQDDWFDQLPGKHRFVFDTTTAVAADQARAFISNFYTANKSGYDLNPADLAVVMIVRHQSTPFAFTDAIWAKYGATFSAQSKFTDPATGQAPAINVYNTTGTTFDNLITRGVHFAVCGMSTRRLAGLVPREAGTTVEMVYQELISNTIRNAHIVPAGIVAVNRAQERGYTFAFVG